MTMGHYANDISLCNGSQSLRTNDPSFANDERDEQVQSFASLNGEPPQRNYSNVDLPKSVDPIVTRYGTDSIDVNDLRQNKSAMAKAVGGDILS